MIDIENELFRILAAKLRAVYSSIFITGDYAIVPPSFPCVSIVEADNTPLRKTQDSGSMENHATIMYEVDVFSNKTSGKKSECKAIIALIDEEMLKLGFDRTFLNPLPNQENTTVYRMKARYVAVVSKDKVIYRR